MLLCGCAGTGPVAPRMRHLVEERQFAEAKKFAYSDDFYTSDENETLKLMEQGLVHYLNREYYQALKAFEKTAELFEQEYTISISKALLSFFSGIKFQADSYELALLYFYQSLSHYHLSRQGYYESFQGLKGTVPQKNLTDSERKRHLEAARALLIQWNDFQEKQENKDKGEKYYARDMLAKSWGGYVHSELGTSSDLQSARILYKGMTPLLNASYKIYPSFDDEAKKNFQEYALKKTNLFSLPSFKRKKQEDNVELIVKAGLISPKEAESFSVPLKIEKTFLKLYKEFVDKQGMIHFEIPTVKKPEKAPSLLLKIYEFLPDTGQVTSGQKNPSSLIDNKASSPVIKNENPEAGKDTAQDTGVALNKEPDKSIALNKGTLVTQKPFVLIEPVSEIAYQEYQNIRPRLIENAVAQITLKYSLAIAAAMATYQSMPPEKKELAYLQLAMTIKLLNYTQYADTRFWSSIPAYIFQQSIQLKKGKYILEIENKEGRILYSDIFDITEKQPILLDINLPKVTFSEKTEKGDTK